MLSIDLACVVGYSSFLHNARYKPPLAPPLFRVALTTSHSIRVFTSSRPSYCYLLLFNGLQGLHEVELRNSGEKPLVRILAAEPQLTDPERESKYDVNNFKQRCYYIRQK